MIRSRFFGPRAHPARSLRLVTAPTLLTRQLQAATPKKCPPNNGVATTRNVRFTPGLTRSGFEASPITAPEETKPLCHQAARQGSDEVLRCFRSRIVTNR